MDGLAGAAGHFGDLLLPVADYPDEPSEGNFSEAWQAQPFAVFYFNCVVVAPAIIAGQLVTVCLAAYALNQLRFSGS